MPTAVALDDATVAFRLADDRIYTAVEQANLSVAHGEFVAIVGPTGLREVDIAERRCRAA
jgi:NitT/TauT family transport system ATP-binding protein